jgi:hypothetical protein
MTKDEVIEFCATNGASLVYVDEKVAHVEQRNGQLMGHPLSFPILCILNLAALKTALRRARRYEMLTAAQARFILEKTTINGDDILFPCPPEFCDLWERTTKEMGLTLSVGKSYASEYFAVINSRQFIQHRKGDLQRIEYANLGLIFNHNLKKRGAEKTPFEIGHALNEMLEFCPMAIAFLPDAMRHRSIGLPLGGYVPNFFVPAHYGGYGVDPKYCDKRSVEVSFRQRQVATLLREDVLKSFTYQNGKVYDKVTAKAMEKLPVPIVVTSSKMPSPPRDSVMDVIIEGKRVRPTGEDFVNLTIARANLENVRRRANNPAQSYGAWVGYFNQTRFPRGLSIETYPRYLSISRLDKLKHKPMSIKKIFDGMYEVLYPQDLPSPVRNMFQYDRPMVRSLSDYAPLCIRTEECSPQRAWLDAQQALITSTRSDALLEKELGHDQSIEELSRRYGTYV